MSPGSSAAPSDLGYEVAPTCPVKVYSCSKFTFVRTNDATALRIQRRPMLLCIGKKGCVPVSNRPPAPNGGGRRVPNAGTPHPPSFFALRRAPSLSTREEVFNCVSTRSGRVARSVLVHAPRRRGGTLEPACETRDPDPLSPPQRQLLKSSGALSSLSFQKDMALEPDARRLASAELRRRSLRSRRRSRARPRAQPRLKSATTPCLSRRAATGARHDGRSHLYNRKRRQRLRGSSFGDGRSPWRLARADNGNAATEDDG